MRLPVNWGPWDLDDREHVARRPEVYREGFAEASAVSAFRGGSGVIAARISAARRRNLAPDLTFRRRR